MFINNLSKNDSKIHLLYKESDFTDNEDIYKIFNYLTTKNERIEKVNVEEDKAVYRLCNYIENEAEDIDTYKVS